MTGILRENKASGLEPPGSFGLVDLEIGLHNHLVDHNFNILAMNILSHFDHQQKRMELANARECLSNGHSESGLLIQRIKVIPARPYNSR